jgi:uncharacterized protein with beta-barrel porin domain
MKHLQLFKKPAMLAAITLSSYINAQQPFGIIGGADIGDNTSYSAFISSSGIAIPINTGLNGRMNGVAMNSSGLGILGGQDNSGPAYAAFVSSSGIPIPITTGISSGAINGVAINSSGLGIIGGQNNGTGQVPYAALVTPSSTGTPVVIAPGLPAMGIINSVAINDSGLGIIGGVDNSGPAYAAVVSPSGIATTIDTGLSNGQIRAVAISDSGQGIIGGQNNGSGYAAIVSPSGTPTPIATSLLSSIIEAVAINSFSQGIIGGQNNGSGYALFVSPSGIATAIGTGISSGNINAVAINDFGQAIIGGQNSNNAGYAAMVSSSGVVTFINTGISNGAIQTVAINDFGQAIIGGEITTGSNPAYAAIVSPSGVATPINLNLSNGVIISVFLPLLSNIPTGSLTGNNLAFANYINKYAPQDAFYLAPSVFDGTLAQALESAAPTRNAFSVYTASNNMFYLTTSLSNRLHNHSTRNRRAAQTPIAAAASVPEDQLMASLTLPEEQNAPLAFISPEKKKQFEQKTQAPERNSTVWFEAIGALAYQKAQHQTPGFDPTTGGAILAVDGKTSEHTRVGGGATYLFTHIHEKKNAGHSNINQEDLFVYATWEDKQFYVDGCVLGGLFQISQVRNIHMAGFDFKSKSHPHGWQLVPHLELGYKYMPNGGRDVELTLNPFVMVDWANAWQGSFKEKGSGPFNAGQKSHHSSLLRSEASLRLYETLFFDAWNLAFQEKAGYVNLQSFGAGKVNAFLVGSPGAFTVETLTSPQNLGVAEFAMIFTPQDSRYPTGTIFYQGEFGVQYQSHQVGLEIDWSF